MKELNIEAKTPVEITDNYKQTSIQTSDFLSQMHHSSFTSLPVA
jgi:hypothetical protein